MSKVKALPYLSKIEPYLPGDFAVEGVTEIIKLSSNESPIGASEAAVKALAQVENDLQTYPDSSAAELRQAIGDKYQLDPEKIVCESGSEQIINLLARAYAQPGDEILYSQYGFIAYKIAALSVGATPVAAAEENHTTCIENLLALVSERTKLVFIANPNNPTRPEHTFLKRCAEPPHWLLVYPPMHSHPGILHLQHIPRRHHLEPVKCLP